MSSDFDEIFGDLKEDQHVAPSLTSDFDADSIFGDVPLGDPIKPSDLSVPEKPRDASTSSFTASSPPPAPVSSAAEQHTSFSIDEQPAASAAGATAGSGEQDDFLSWLDDAPKPGTASESVGVEEKEPAPVVTEELPPEPSSSTAEPSLSMDTVPLDEMQSVPPVVDESIEPVLDVVTPTVDVVPVVETAAPACDEISLDDDDDDDYLEKIVQNANRKQQAGSREASSSSLAIKSHSQAQQQPQIGAYTLDLAYCES